MNLYQIEQEIRDAIRVDEETGEIICDEEYLDHLVMEQAEKREQIALWIKDIAAEINALRMEEQALANRRHKAEEKKASLTAYLESDLDGEKFKTPRCEISWSRSKGVAVVDSDRFFAWAREHPDMVRQKPPEPNKTAIKEKLKDGEEIPGCLMYETNNMRIK